MSHPINLSGMSLREAISDSILRCVIGLDTNNKALFESAWSKDEPVVFDMGQGPISGLENITAGMFNHIGPLDTHHNISNVRVDHKPEAKSAYLTAYALAQHHPAGTGVDTTKTRHLTSGSHYYIDVVEDSDGVWRVKNWNMTVVWLDGDLSVVSA